jgi:hypothetical protein
VEHEEHTVDRVVERRTREPDDLVEAVEGERLPGSGPRSDGRDHVAPGVVQDLPSGAELAQGLGRYVGSEAEDLRAKIVDGGLAGGEGVRLDREGAEDAQSGASLVEEPGSSGHSTTLARWPEALPAEALGTPGTISGWSPESPEDRLTACLPSAGRAAFAARHLQVWLRLEVELHKSTPLRRRLLVRTRGRNRR